MKLPHTSLASLDTTSCTFTHSLHLHLLHIVRTSGSSSSLKRRGLILLSGQGMGLGEGWDLCISSAWSGRKEALAQSVDSGLTSPEARTTHLGRIRVGRKRGDKTPGDAQDKGA
ncbi:hypothetical protein E2C01_088933 [Portunus trituberculatus]|uniref:Uncharacterized protein n=1 Tax=Portunus trituberculatus TaxID=210409 RepID=A0A5B7JC63_PORTR|nr:hypothetical protein [Portunus trituberculatus]